jgi:hypothetical protein
MKPSAKAILGGVLGVAALSGGCGGTASTAEPIANVPATPEKAPEVQAILQKMSARYRDAHTYSDTGTHRAVYRPHSMDERTVTATFQTHWASPKQLRFELRRENRDTSSDEMAIWTSPGGAVKVLHLDEVRAAPSLDDGLHALQGVSGGTTGMVPRWLADGGLGSRATYELRGKTACGSASCFEVTGSLRADERVTLYVDVNDYALRKAVWLSKITPQPIPAEVLAKLPPAQRAKVAALDARSQEPFEVESTIELEPIFDRPIDASVFAIDRPETKPAAH